MEARDVNYGEQGGFVSAEMKVLVGEGDALNCSGIKAREDGHLGLCSLFGFVSFLKDWVCGQGSAAHTRDPSCLGGKDQEHHSSRPAWANS
jgi:hypothetical protein